MDETDFVAIEYIGRHGNHIVTSPTGALQNAPQRHYGIHSHGSRFKVHPDDVKAAPHLFKPIEPSPTHVTVEENDAEEEAVDYASMPLDELKQVAEDKGIDPDGDARLKKTWVAALEAADD